MRQVTIATKGTWAWMGIPGIERAEANGRLWATLYTGGPKEPDPDNVVLLTTSADDGATWSAPQVVAAPPGPTRAYDPCLWHDPAGRLWLFYNHARRATDGEGRADFSVWAMVADDASSDDASSTTPAWSPPRRLALGAPGEVPFAFRMNKPTVLTDGTWALPVTWAREVPASSMGGWFPGPGQLQGVALSHDQGVTWALHGAIEAPHWALESMVVERRDGRLWMLIRTGAGVLWQSFSEDGGRTWSGGSPTAIVNPGTRFFIRRLASGRLLLINTPHPKERTGMVAFLSEPDDDDAFSQQLVLDPRERVSYPDAVESPAGRIYAIHDRDRAGVGEVILTVFDEAEVVSRR